MAPKKDPNFGAQGKLGGMGGKYGRKAENLTNKELKAAGGAKAAATRKVDISQTKRDTTRGITLGPKGKPLTGKVVLQNGNTAVYKDGKRVVAAKKSTSPNKNNGKDTSVSAADRARAAAMKSGKADAAKRSAAGVDKAPNAARKAASNADAKKRVTKNTEAKQYKSAWTEPITWDGFRNFMNRGR
jgi:hypothetical protein